MELSSQKRAKICKRKRLAKNRRRNQRKVEVRSAKRRKIASNTSGPLTDGMNFSNMTADTFWENYKVAQDWQQKHNVAWWKSRCIALEHENQVLRDKVRELSKNSNYNNNHPKPLNFRYNASNDSPEEGNLEFHVDDEMLNFLEQSIRHKMELKRTRESEQRNSTILDSNECSPPIREIQDHEKMENAVELYGTLASRIIAMETALQMTVDRHKDRAKPHYWPNIPLNP